MYSLTEEASEGQPVEHDVRPGDYHQPGTDGMHVGHHLPHSAQHSPLEQRHAQRERDDDDAHSERVQTNCEKDVTMSDAANDDPITARNIGSVQLRDAIP